LRPAGVNHSFHEVTAKAREIINGGKRNGTCHYLTATNATLNAPKFYGVIAAGIIIGIAMDLLRVDAIKALFWSAVLNGVAAVPLLAVIVWLASKSSIMGVWKSSVLARAWGWGTVALMGAATLGMFVFMAKGS
jgi:Mn2+/Fe2+ NRAMP family transporter